MVTRGFVFGFSSPRLIFCMYWVRWLLVMIERASCRISKDTDHLDDRWEGRFVMWLGLLLFPYLGLLVWALY